MVACSIVVFLVHFLLGNLRLRNERVFHEAASLASVRVLFVVFPHSTLAVSLCSPKAGEWQSIPIFRRALELEIAYQMEAGAITGISCILWMAWLSGFRLVKNQIPSPKSNRDSEAFAPLTK